jgi:GNAT superfamily N-acetyltransferase
MHIRPLGPEEAELHRAVRLRALRDAPDSFGETLADALAQPASYWDELTRHVTGASGQIMVLACEGHEVVGSAYGLLDRERRDMGRVGGMWVDPGRRRRGVGKALLGAVLDWGRERGLARLGLWAPAHQPAAIALYTGAGFRETGERRPLRAGGALFIIAMEAHVGPPRTAQVIQ